MKWLPKVGVVCIKVHTSKKLKEAVFYRNRG